MANLHLEINSAFEFKILYVQVVLSIYVHYDITVLTYLTVSIHCQIGNTSCELAVSMIYFVCQSTEYYWSNVPKKLIKGNLQSSSTLSFFYATFLWTQCKS